MNAPSRRVIQGQTVKIIKPDTAEPIPLPSSRQNIAIILIRFVLFLAIAVVVLSLAYIK
ncbi:hypothetical protein GCM10022626_05270 [[Pseudomonas] carboxydohydrogena]